MIEPPPIPSGNVVNVVFIHRNKFNENGFENIRSKEIFY